MSSKKIIKKETEWKPLVNNYKVPMVRIVFTKKEILKAIQKTPIQHGTHFQFYKTPDVFRSALASKCDVDCIGAILRTYLKSDVLGVDGNAIVWSLGVQGSIYHSEEEFLSEKQYLSALNTYFEKTDRDYRISKSDIKVLVSEFVRKNFPTKFTMKVSTEFKRHLK